MKFLHHTYFLPSRCLQTQTLPKLILNIQNPAYFIFILIQKLQSWWSIYTSVRDFHAQGPEQHETVLKRLLPGRKGIVGAQGLRSTALGCFPRLEQAVPAIPPGPGGKNWGYGYSTIYCSGSEHHWDLLGAGNKLLQWLQREISVGTVKGQEDICSCCSCHAAHCSTHAQPPSTCHAADTLHSSQACFTPFSNCPP